MHQSQESIRSYKSRKLEMISHLTWNNSRTLEVPILYGVTQRSILGPYFFSISVNDIVSAMHEPELIIYADGTNVLISGNYVHQVSKKS